MRKNDIEIVTATIHISDIYYFDAKCFYAFDIRFQKPSCVILNHKCFIFASENDKKAAKEFLNKVKAYFASADIHEGTDVNLLVTKTGDVQAISRRGKDLWIDVRNGINPTLSLKEFSELGFKIISISKS